MPSKIHLLSSLTAIVTGGTTGIGRAIILAYIRHGCNVAVNHLGLPKDAGHLSSLIAEAALIRADDSEAGMMIEVQGDVQDPETARILVKRTVEERGWSGMLDICVSNAGVCRMEEFLNIDQNLFTQTLNTNLSGGFYICQSAARQMVAQYLSSSDHPNSQNDASPSFLSQSPSPPVCISPSPHSRTTTIITISSISALQGGSKQCHYTPTKAGVLSLARSMACALGKYNVRCNALLPGEIKTQLNEELLMEVSNGTSRTREEEMNRRIPMGRVGRPEDIAGPAVWLANGELSGYVNGAGIVVDGGWGVALQ